MSKKDHQRVRGLGAGVDGATMVGRTFILGLPDTHGIYHIGLQRQLWRIEAGQYSAGDRVQVVSVDTPFLVVRAMFQRSGAEED